MLETVGQFRLQYNERAQGTLGSLVAMLSLLSRGVHEVFHVSMLQKYTPDPTHVVDWGEITIDTDGTFEEGPVRIMDSRDQVLRRKTVRLVKLIWQHRGVEEETWERKDMMRVTYPFFLGMKVHNLVV